VLRCGCCEDWTGRLFESCYSFENLGLWVCVFFAGDMVYLGMETFLTGC